MTIVVAAALESQNGRILMQKRPPGKQHGGLWEFPGGKVEEGETRRAALIRELEEELGIAVDPGSLEPAGCADNRGSGEEREIVILLYKARAWQGEPVAEAGAEIGWFTLPGIARLAMPPLDFELLDHLALGAG